MLDLVSAVLIDLLDIRGLMDVKRCSANEAGVLQVNRARDHGHLVLWHAGTGLKISPFGTVLVCPRAYIRVLLGYSLIMCGVEIAEACVLGGSFGSAGCYGGEIDPADVVQELIRDGFVWGIASLLEKLLRCRALRLCGWVEDVCAGDIVAV